MAVVCRPGAIADLEKILKDRNCSRVFLVSGQNSLRRSGAINSLTDLLQSCNVTHFTDVDQNPSIEQLESGLAKFRDAKPDIIIAVGGGSAMDIAKLIKIFSYQSQPPRRYVEGKEKLVAAAMPLVAIPTTAGSGSQATHFAVLYIDKSKFSVAHPSMLPDEALVDPALLKSVPPAVAASAGLDALNQGIESYWSIHSTNESKAIARNAIELTWAGLRDITSDPGEDVYLTMATGAHRAGEAINITKTTAPHAVSYPITAYFGVPHGQATGLILAAVLRYNALVADEDCLDSRGPAYVRNTMHEIAGLLGQPDANAAADAYNEMMEAIGLSRDFYALGIDSETDIDTIVEHGFNPQRVGNNPRRLTATALRKMLIELRNQGSPQQVEN
ncbi:MAG: phosphonoacetaldehyde reductase [Woeseiaceae bacterium]